MGSSPVEPHPQVRTGGVWLGIAVLLLALVDVTRLSVAVVTWQFRPVDPLLATYVAVMSGPLYVIVLGLLGRVLARVRPARWADWRAALPESRDADVVAYWVLRAPLDDVRRIGARKPGQYRRARRLERRAGLRLSDVCVGQAPLARLFSLLPKFRPLWWVEPERLRQLVLLAEIAEQPPRKSPLADIRWDELAEAARGAECPIEVAGWAIARQVSIEQGWMDSWEPFSTVLMVWPDQDGMPGWLRPLAGFAPGEPLPEDATREGLLALAALRGEPVHLLPRPTSTGWDLSARTGTLGA